MRVYTDTSQVGVGAAVTASATVPDLQVATAVQVTIQPAATGGATTGTVALKFRAVGARFDEALLDVYGAPVVITLAANTSVTREFSLVAGAGGGAVTGVPSSADGAYDMITSFTLADWK